MQRREMAELIDGKALASYKRRVAQKTAKLKRKRDSWFGSGF